MSVDKKINYEDQRLTEKQKKKIKPVNQGGGPNYLGKQETVTVPKKWLSDPDHVVAELAYITPREKKILLDADLYGSLKGKPNRGPGGIQSLQGDMGSVGGGGTSSGGNGGGISARDRHMGLQGKTGKTDPSIGGGGVDDRGTPEQNANQRAQVRAGRVRDLEQFIDRPTFGFTDAAKVNLLSPKSIGTGLLSLATGFPFGLMNFFSNLSTRPSTNFTEDDDIFGGGGGGGDGGNQIPIMGGIMSTVAPTVKSVVEDAGITATTAAADPNRQAYYDALYQQLIQGGINPTSAADIAQYRTSINFG